MLDILLFIRFSSSPCVHNSISDTTLFKPLLIQLIAHPFFGTGMMAGNETRPGTNTGVFNEHGSPYESLPPPTKRRRTTNWWVYHLPFPFSLPHHNFYPILHILSRHPSGSSAMHCLFHYLLCILASSLLCFVVIRHIMSHYPAISLLLYNAWITHCKIHILQNLELSDECERIYVVPWSDLMGIVACYYRKA
jgi:hypothetical protein